VTVQGFATSGPAKPAPKPKPKPRAKPKPKPAPAPSVASRIVTYAHTLLGIHEVPAHSNSGEAVRRIQAATGAYGAPWCVSTVQHIALHVTGHTIADRTANAYYLADYGARHGWVRPRPVLGGPVVYHLGAGHAGTVVQVLADGSFYAIEGNEGDAVRLMHRSPHAVRCVFLQPPYLQ
jgi:hypothetical protein